MVSGKENTEKERDKGSLSEIFSKKFRERLSCHALNKKLTPKIFKKYNFYM